MQRWALFLSAFQYDIVYRPTAQHSNADCLSRLPVQSELGTECDQEVQLLHSMQIDILPINVDQMRTATRYDPILTQVLKFMFEGWPSQVSPELQPFFNHRDQLTTMDRCLLWGMRVIVPAKHRKQVSEELHIGHHGIVCMKPLARIHVWWPKIDRDMTNMVHRCSPCQSNRSGPTLAPMHPWVWPTYVWQRIHIDFAGPFLGHMFLLVVDSHSKWLEVEILPIKMSYKRTIQCLRSLFVRYGLPDQLVSDNGPQFVSHVFKQFTRNNGVKHIRIM